MDFNQFKASHGGQLQMIPEIYWESLHQKLSCEVYDAGGYFTMSPCEERWKVLVSNKDGVSASNPSHVFLIDHAWTFQPPSVRQLLLTVPGLAHRMAVLMDIVKLPTADSQSSDSYDADSESDEQGQEKADSSDSASSPVDQSDCSPVPLPPPSTEDGYRTGDLGDVSQSCTTEHAQQSDESESSSLTPPQTFEDRYKLAEDKLAELNVSNEPAPAHELVDKIISKMWSYSHAYHVNNSSLPIWYIMDEFGSRVQQLVDPSVAMTVFFYIPSQLAFTVMWPLKDLTYADEVTCNFVPQHVKQGLEYKCHALPWSHDNHMTLDDPLWEELSQFKCPPPAERCDEVYSNLSAHCPPLKSMYHVHTDDKVVINNLTLPQYKVGSSQENADILWLAEHFKDFKSLKPHQYVNQFPCENMLTCKDLLVLVAKRANHSGTSPPDWLPLTFNLLYELPNLVREHMERDKKGEVNVWIVKPWNLGRGLGITVTDNLHQIIRLAQIGPKVASRYISDPVLFKRDDVGWVKFDVRYIVMLKSVSPLELYVYNTFWLRFANKPFSLDDFHDYDKHFTVMNYTDGGVRLKQIHDVDFIPMFESMYKDISWSSVQDKMYSVIKEIFKAAVDGQPPAALAPCTQSRAMYGLDMMLEWTQTLDGNKEMSPRLLEVNYCPCCVRAAKYTPQFYNHVFQTLFDVDCDSKPELPVTRLL